MRTLTGLIALAMAASATCAHAAQDRPITDTNPNAVDVAKTPVTDLNIDSQKIPDLLVNAEREPYTLAGLRSCRALAGAVSDLDSMLGPDIDLPQEDRERITAGRVAKTVVSSFIPFRGIIREVSGANAHDRRLNAAIQAGLARRGFLKGVGAQRGCPYPARPADARVIASYAAQGDATPPAKQDRKDDDRDSRQPASTPDSNRYVSQPVVQKTP